LAGAALLDLPVGALWIFPRRSPVPARLPQESVQPRRLRLVRKTRRVRGHSGRRHLIMIALVILGILLVLLFLGFPMKVPLMAAALAVILFFFPASDPSTLIQQMIGGVEPAALIAVPMFILAAEIMTRGQAADRLLDLVMRMVGHVRGGLPVASAVSCTLFGALSGSTQATVVAIGGPLRPKMLKAGYSD